MSRILSTAGTFVDTIKINVLTREYRDGRALWIKRRRWTAAPVMACANRFFRRAGNPIQALTKRAEWQRWEVDCFLRLHGADFEAFAEGACAVAAEEVPGTNLSRHLEAGTLTPPMLAAAARELRRAHKCECPMFRGQWSHGDPHAGNFVFDAAENRARLIDFEVRHDPTLSAAVRHADDLLILLQDLAGRLAAPKWLPLAHAFIGAYARPEVIALLREKLVVPSAWAARMWWAVRTTYLAPVELTRRIADLRQSL